MASLLKLGAEALKVQKFLKDNTITPIKEYDNLQEKDGVWIYTQQVAFRTKAEAEIFVKMCNLIDSSVFHLE